MNSIYKRLNDKDLSEDIVQNIFLRLWNKRETVKIEDLAAYLHTAARYEVLNFVTRKRICVGFYEPMEEILIETDRSDDRLITAEIMNLVHAYANTLPERKRQVFLLHVHSRFSTKEIADKLSISQKTVQNQLHTALNGLRPHIYRSIFVILASNL